MAQFIGIDVSEQRGCAIAALNEDGSSSGSLWCRSSVLDVVAAIQGLSGPVEVVIGIDSPRQPLSAPRPWYWNSRTNQWRSRKTTEQGWGRHCEVVVSSLRLANPQWSRPLDVTPNWMRFGFELFVALDQVGRVHEVFPSASYTQLSAVPAPVLRVSLAEVSRGPKDLLDAHVAALTALEFEMGRGSAVGDGDLLGTIVLPRPVGSAPAELLTWPKQHTERRGR